MVYNYCDVELDNPLLVASSPFTESYRKASRCLEEGAAGIVTKTISGDTSMEPGRSLERYRDGFLTKSDDPSGENLPLERGREIIEKLKANHENEAVIASIDPVYSVRERYSCGVEESGADAMEIPLKKFLFKSENFKSLYHRDSTLDGLEVFKEGLEDVKKEITRIYKNTETDIPVCLKYPPEIMPFHGEFMGLGDGVTYFDGMEYRNGEGVIVGTEQLKMMHQTAVDECDGKISACGGIKTKEDVENSLRLGASSVQVCSVLFKDGTGLISELSKAKERGKRNLREIYLSE